MEVMKMKVFLLAAAAAVVLLGRPATAGHVQHKSLDILNKVIDLISSYNKSLTLDTFVEDVTHLAEGRNKCQDKFFCKVSDILRANVNKGVKENLARTLKSFVDARIPNCAELQRNMTSTDISKPLPTLLENLSKCIRSRRYRRK